MFIIAKDAEEKLLEELQVYKREHPSHYCFYMAFSKSDVPKKELFNGFLRLLQDLPDSYMAQIYICQDMDVFILMQGFMQQKFTTFLQDLSKELDTDNLKKLATSKEIGSHWAELETMCQRKIEVIQHELAKQEEKERKEVTENATLEVLNKLDPDLVSMITKRREERQEPSIMVVDDDQISLTLIGNAIKDHYNWNYAKDGKSALTDYVRIAPDVLFLDIGLPDINGHDVLECLFQIDPSAYVIMFSGRKDKENIMRALETGAKGFVGKPFTREKILRYINLSPFILDKRLHTGSDIEENKAENIM